jgi:membrane protease YdiL (CAAX protease family)
VSSRTLGLGAALALLLAGLGTSGVRVFQLERGELEHEASPRSLAQLGGAPGSTRVSARLAKVELRGGEDALFELCSTDRLDAARWRGAFELAVFHLPDMRLMLRVPLDDAHLAEARRSARGACLSLGGGRIERAGEYSLDAVWPERAPAEQVARVPIYARVLARRPLAPSDRYAVWVIAGGVGLCLALAMTRARAPSSVTDAPPQRSDKAPLLLALATLLAIAASSQVPTPGAALTFAKGIGLASLQAGAAWLLARFALRSAPRDALALSPPARAGAWTALALAAGAALYVLAGLSLRLIPATGEAPIQTFVSWPSGMLCFAALGALLPIGEELFFRGYLYRAALARGTAFAFFASLIPFVALHAQQSWGNWGALTSIAVTGVVLTGLRARSGSSLVPAIAHVVYNFALSMASF